MITALYNFNDEYIPWQIVRLFIPDFKYFPLEKSFQTIEQASRYDPSMPKTRSKSISKQILFLFVNLIQSSLTLK